jgi:hypothetical protein
MYRLCLMSVGLFALGTGASLAEGSSTPAADNIATIDSAAPTALDSPSTTDANSNAERSPAVGSDAQSTRATKRSTRRHATPAPTKTGETAPSNVDGTAPSNADETAPLKTVELKDTGERTKCEEIGLPGSRIVLGKRCYTYNINDRSEMKLADEKKEQTKQTMSDLRRMQDNLELEQRQQEWNRERAAAAMVVGGGH